MNYLVRATEEYWPPVGHQDHPKSSGFNYPGYSRPIPLANLYIPNSKINPVHDEVVKYYATKGKEGKPYKAGGVNAKPSAFISSEIPKNWVKFNQDEPVADYPNFILVDGVHRARAAESNGKKLLQVKLESKWDFEDLF